MSVRGVVFCDMTEDKFWEMSMDTKQTHIGNSLVPLLPLHKSLVSNGKNFQGCPTAAFHC
jgi:hypothetical protein